MRHVPGQRLVVCAITLGLVWVLGGHHTLATPATPDVSPPAQCDIPPRPFDELTDLLAETAIATPPATTSGQTLPAGTPANAKAASEIEGLVRRWLACQNAGEPLRAWSLFSDGYLYRLLSRQGQMSAADYDALATPELTPSEDAELLEIQGERNLPDGRLGATVSIAYPSVPIPKTFFFFFTRVDGRLKIDGILGEISFSVP